jgi:lipid-A-disaccharide synthase
MKVYVVAGEASGDRLGAALMVGLNGERPGITYKGIAGPLMQAEGIESLFPMEELSVMGIAEVLPKYPELRRRLHQTVDDILAFAPDVLITIDSPDFCLRVARLVRDRQPIRTVHYVAPSVWAWRAGRAKKMARYVDHVLALLPFEPPYMEAEGMACDFVGHPVVSEPVATQAEAQAFRDTHRIGEAPLILALPGSRSGEIGRLVPTFGAALRGIARPECRVVILAAPGRAERLREMTGDWPSAPILVDTGGPGGGDAKRAALKAADVALAASGTVSLELAANATPMVIAYDMNWLSWQIMSRMANIDTVTLVNLVTGTHAVPEYLGPACKPEAIAGALNTLLDNPDAAAAQHAAMQETMEKLGKGGEAPGLRAAKAVLNKPGAPSRQT